MGTLSHPPDLPSIGTAPMDMLSRFERINFRLVDVLLRRGTPLTEVWLRRFTDLWIGAATSRMLEWHGLARLANVPHDRGFILVSNHRSYFDLYLLSLILNRNTPLRQPIVCPVRADFFYEKPLGLLVNVLVGGGRMYPPVFRQAEKIEFNKWSLQRLIELVREGAMIGFHPEGTRNKGADPYVPLPAQTGIGKLVMETWPVVVPAFINGLGNDFLGDVKSNFTDPAKRVIAVFGEPIELSQFRGQSNRLATHKKIADTILGRIYQLGQEERAIRATPRAAK